MRRRISASKPVAAMTEYVTPAGTAESVFEVKKSRFIAKAGLVTSRDQAMAFLQGERDAYPDARHHCWAYLLGESAATLSAAMSDDGEPSGTAGKPILNVLQHKGVGNVMVVVSRYFGGVKLGAGGLVRAYSSAAQQVMEQLPLQRHRPMITHMVECDFATEQPLRHWLQNHDGTVVAVNYSEQACIEVAIPAQCQAAFQQFASANHCTLTEA